MKERVLALINEVYPVSKETVGEFEKINLMGMDFITEKFKAEGLGYVSWMTAEGMGGAMKMDTVVINAFNMDMPLFSYDRIKAMGKDTCIVEMYDTMLGPIDLSGFDAAKAKAEGFENMPEPGERWYDAIRFPQSIAKVGTDSETFDEIVIEYIKEYLRETKTAAKCDPEEKKAKAGEYSTSLANNGGMAADNFIKVIGKEKTLEFFKTALFNA